jgi:photosystem II stability/assembly factor-like uncharacterized protein
MKHGKIATGAGICAALMLPLLASASDIQHCYLRDASSPAASTAYLLCEQGLVYGTTNAGANWTAHDTGAAVVLHSVSFQDPTHGLVVGDGGTLLATEDGAKTWQARTTGIKEHLLSVFTLGNLAWAGGFEGTLLHSIDGGHTWSKQNSGTTMALESVFFLDADHGWAVGWSGTILRTTDGGKTWQTIKTDAAQWSLAAVRFIDPNNGWAVGFSGQLLHSADGGTTWKAQKSPTQSWLTSVATDSAKRVWIAGDENLLVSDDGGANWRAIPVPGSFFVSKLFRMGDSLWGLAELGILRQVGSGLQWKHDETFIPAGARIGDTVDDTPTAAAATGATGKGK